MDYASLERQYQAILVGRWITDLSNTSAFLATELKDINWVGFYFLVGNELILGPFQGRPACTHIKSGRGVCGRAVVEKRTLLVEDVNKFVDHIVCDSASQSEIVVPLILNGVVVGVLDVDAPIIGRFGNSEQIFLEQITTGLLLKNQINPLPIF
jgi:GAF domain-containing protein